MKFTITAIILSCFVSATGFSGVLKILHFKSSNRPGISMAGQNCALGHAVGSNKREALKLGEVHGLIAAAAQKHGVPIALVHSIVATESSFRSDAVSSRGSIGLMQLLPSTARQYGADAKVPAQNIDAGTRYLRFLIEKYRNSSSPLQNVIAAYNAGFGAVDHYHGVPPFRETQGYVNRVLALMRQYDET